MQCKLLRLLPQPLQRQLRPIVLNQHMTDKRKAQTLITPVNKCIFCRLYFRTLDYHKAPIPADPRSIDLHIHSIHHSNLRHSLQHYYFHLTFFVGVCSCTGDYNFTQGSCLRYLLDYLPPFYLHFTHSQTVVTRPLPIERATKTDSVTVLAVYQW